MGVELGHDEEAPLVELGALGRVARHVDVRRRLECFADVLDDRGALADDEVAVPQDRHLVARIELEESGVIVWPLRGWIATNS